MTKDTIPTKFKVRIVKFTDNGYPEYCIEDGKSMPCGGGEIVWRGEVTIEDKNKTPPRKRRVKELPPELKAPQTTRGEK